MNATSATPTVSAPAVTAVRAGLRLLFSRASMPAAPVSFSNGRPSAAASGATSHRETNARHTNRTAAPAASQQQTRARGEPAREQARAEHATRRRRR